NDQRRRLETMDQRVRRPESPVGVGLVPHTVEPDAADRAILGQQLLELPIHEAEVAWPLAALGAAGGVPGASAGPIVAVVPVELRVVEEEPEPLLPTLSGQLLHRVAREGSPVDDVVARRLRAEHGEA